jgi:ATP-dependent helicase/nuclease subunit B
VAVALNLFTVPPHRPFLDAVAGSWLAASGADPLSVADGLILLPTRRAARALAEAFLRAAGGRPLLLPRITALGALDETPLALDGALDLPPAVEPMQRLAALTMLILRLNGQAGAPRTADRAWKLAAELAALMDEAERAEINLASRLPDAADPAYAAHWAATLKFLHIVTDAWPVWLADNGLMNPAARQVALLDAQAAAWAERPPVHRVLIAGTTAGIPAVARLLRVVAGLDRGQVVLPVLDRGMDDATWEALEDSHPQAGLRRLLTALGATRGDVGVWQGAGGALSVGAAVAPTLPLPLREGAGGRGPLPGSTETSAPLAPPPPPAPLPRGEGESPAPWDRFDVLSRALLPASALGTWRDAPPGPLSDLWRLTPADQQEEAEAIALVLRDTLETPGARAALVTPDRDLAGRVAAALLRYGVVADDSAGEPLADTPPAVFLRLLTRAVADELAPVPLLALLKHPLAAAGLSPAACRSAARSLELACLRGPRPSHGVAGLRRAVDKAGGASQVVAFLQRLEACLEPALRIEAAVEAPPAAALAAIIEAAERLAASHDTPGPARLWAGEEGEALATRLAAVQAAIAILPDQRRAVLPGLLDAVLEGVAVRSRRALRGRGGQEHPRVFIWGLLEARLQSVDRMVLGGLAETVWPPAPEPGPWLSRPMRATVGLPSPEEAVGQAAHDFVAAACSSREVVLCCPARRDGAPAVPARWLTRLEMFLLGHQRALPEHPAAVWAREMDLPADGPRPALPPRPCPPVALRPSRLSVTEIETWLRDPYAIYARHILHLTALKPLDEETDASDYGALVHKGIHLFLREHGTRWPPNAADAMCRLMNRALAEADLREALAAWWAPRLARIADWVTEAETARRSEHPPVAIETEIGGALDLPRPGRRFRLTGRADRIERLADGTLAILDYKTGRTPSQAEVDAGLAPQLLLEAAMAEAGGFGASVRGTAVELLYWHLTGGFEPGAARLLFRGKPDLVVAATASAQANLCGLIDAFDAPDRCYLAHPHPDWAPRFSDYAQLARVAEWSAAGEEG